MRAHATPGTVQDYSWLCAQGNMVPEIEPGLAVRKTIALIHCIISPALVCVRF